MTHLVIHKAPTEQEITEYIRIIKLWFKDNPSAYMYVQFPWGKAYYIRSTNIEDDIKEACKYSIISKLLTIL